MWISQSALAATSHLPSSLANNRWNGCVVPLNNKHIWFRHLHGLVVYLWWWKEKIACKKNHVSCQKKKEWNVVLNIPTEIISSGLSLPVLGLRVWKDLHSEWPRSTTTTDDWLVEAKSLEESEEKQSCTAECSAFGKLDTWREEGGRRGRMSFVTNIRHLKSVLFNIQSPCLLT